MLKEIYLSWVGILLFFFFLSEGILTFMDSETKGGMWDELREGIPTRRKLISARRALGTKQI